MRPQGETSQVVRLPADTFSKSAANGGGSQGDTLRGFQPSRSEAAEANRPQGGS